MQGSAVTSRPDHLAKVRDAKGAILPSSLNAWRVTVSSRGWCGWASGLIEVDDGAQPSQAGLTGGAEIGGPQVFGAHLVAITARSRRPRVLGPTPPQISCRHNPRQCQRM